ncbi:MAG: cell envelope biogenesis protein OmpA [Alphaproteobacteria bacterium]|nr:cell envelope biogenesis protein OmpA [Alphaproteobacteria bacterium]
MVKSKIVVLLVMAAALGGCENMTTGQKGALTGAALGTGIGMVAGGSFGEVVGAGLIGGAAGYIAGSAIGNNK